MKLLRANNLTLIMGNKTICTELNLQINAGEIWGILGPNGSGKTTLLHALAGLQTIAHGDILLQDQSLSTLTRKQIAQSIGILFQENTHTFPQTVWDYCSAGRFPHRPYFNKKTTEDMQITTHSLQVMNLNELAHRATHQLSGGEKRRLAIATVLTQTPAIYLLDEPTNHLDIHHQMQLLSHLTYLARARSRMIVMSLHDANQAHQHCDHILMLFNDGSSVQGKTEEVMTSENLSRLYGHRMKQEISGSTIFWWPEMYHEHLQPLQVSRI